MSESIHGGAIVTGASSGIGLAISERLIKLGYEVYGIGRIFDEKEEWMEDDMFHEVVCDLLDEAAMIKTLKSIREDAEIELLVNNAGTAYYGLHEELSPAKIQIMVRTNLEVPLILSQQLMRDFKKCGGTIINISSVTATHASPHGAAYGATKAGLLSFGESLFEEARKYGVRVTTILPDMTATDLYRNADFREGEETQSYLVPEEVADAVEYVLSQRRGVVIPELMLRPQIQRIRRK